MKRYVKVICHNLITESSYPIWVRTNKTGYARYEERNGELIELSKMVDGSEREYNLGKIIQEKRFKPWFVKPWRIL